MSLRSQVPVEPLDADRVAALERNVLTAYRATEPTPRRRFGLGWRIALPAAALVAAIAVLVPLYLTRSSSPRNAAVTAAAPVKVASLSGESSRLALDGAVVTIGADTTIHIWQKNGGYEVVLDSGVVDCQVDPVEGAHYERPPFAVIAGDVAVRVVGTSFRVERDEDGVRVTVTEGKVAVTSGDTDRVIAAGESWASDGVKIATADDAATPPPSPADVKPGRAIAKKPKTPTKKKKANRTKKRNGKVDRTAKPKNNDEAEKSAGASRAFGFASRMPGSIPELMQVATGKAAGDARHAFYSMVYKYFAERKFGDAVRAAKQFARRFPSGKYAQDVLVIRIKALCRRGISSGCRAAAHTYLRKYSGDQYTPRAQELVSDVTQ